MPFISDLGLLSTHLVIFELQRPESVAGVLQMVDVQTGVTIGKVRRWGRLSDASTRTVARFLIQRDVSEDDIDRGLHYAELHGALTIREGFVLAMSRVTLSNEQLQAGVRFDFGE